MGAKLPLNSVLGVDTGKEIVLYGFSYCVHCIDGRAFLESRGIGFKYVFLDEASLPQRSSVTPRLRRAYGKRLIFPVLEVDGDLAFGFDAEQWDALLSAE